MSGLRVDAIKMQSRCSHGGHPSALGVRLLGDKAPTRMGPCMQRIGRHKLKAF